MKLTLLATGGTIACTDSADGLTPTLRAADILNSVKDRLPCEVCARDVFLMDSSNMQPEEWSALALAVDEALADSDGVVITHGTDTMAYTAAALSFMLAGAGKPIMLTGSQLPLSHPLTDARQNLLLAMSAAMLGVAGVYVCFGSSIISGVRCVKTHTTSLNAFSSVNAPLAGRFDVDGVTIDKPQPYEPLIAGEPYRPRVSLDPRVFLMKLAPGTSPDALKFVGEAGYRGLVIEAFGLGGLHYIRRNLVRELQALSERGVYALVVSQCLYERANLTVYEVGKGFKQNRVISGRDMTTEAAVCKLMWALGQDEPERWLRNKIVGEWDEQGRRPCTPLKG